MVGTHGLDARAESERDERCAVVDEVAELEEVGGTDEVGA